MHSTNNLDDGYMGSGRRLRASIRKYGKRYHMIVVLEYCDSRELLIEAEKKAITEDMIGDKDCMNLMGGGDGGFVSKEACTKGGTTYMEKYGGTDTFFDCRSKGGKATFEKHGVHEGFKCDWNGRKHSEETKEKMRDSKKGQGVGKTNSQYGTCWITKDGSNKKVNKDDLDQYVLDGWVKGRKKIDYHRH